MVLVLAKESKYANTCARETCVHKTEVGKPYVWDTDKSKAYCSKECAEMDTGGKVVENGSSSKKSFGGYTKPVQQLWRTPDEGITACKFWHETVVPMILETCKKIFPPAPNTSEFPDKDIFAEVSLLYAEIFLGKFQGGSKN